MRKVLNEAQQKAITKYLDDEYAKLDVSARGISKTSWQTAKILVAIDNVCLVIYKWTHPHVIHLAKHAKKTRVRKKNINRIRRMK